jgi:hypothetical protein
VLKRQCVLCVGHLPTYVCTYVDSSKNIQSLLYVKTLKNCTKLFDDGDDDEDEGFDKII